MKCRTLHKKLIFFIENELPPKEMHEVENHLNKCPDCLAFAEEIKKTLAIVHLEKAVEVSPFFYTRLKARMLKQEEMTLQKKQFPLWENILQPAMFTVLLVGGIYTGIKIGKLAETNMPTSGYEIGRAHV